jgi:hypothetical protein
MAMKTLSLRIEMTTLKIEKGAVKTVTEYIPPLSMSLSMRIILGDTDRGEMFLVTLSWMM